VVKDVVVDRPLQVCQANSQNESLSCFRVKSIAMYFVLTDLSQVRRFHCRPSAVHIRVNWPLVCTFTYTTNSWTFSARRSNPSRQVASISTSTARHVGKQWCVCLICLYYIFCCIIIGQWYRSPGIRAAVHHSLEAWWMEKIRPVGNVYRIGVNALNFLSHFTLLFEWPEGYLATVNRCYLSPDVLFWMSGGKNEVSS